MVIQDLEQLCTVSGVAGNTEITETARRLLEPLVDECTVDAMGNVIGVRKGSADVVLLEAHMDEIGFLVTDIDASGFVHVDATGGIDLRVLAGQDVRVFGKLEFAGVFCSIPPHLKKENDKLPSVRDCAIDIGLSGEEAKKEIPLGSRVGFAPQFHRLSDHFVASKSLDDRAGMAAILHCLRSLSSCSKTIVVAFCVQEEIGCRGSLVAARIIMPTVAIATDVSFGMTRDSDARLCAPCGNGAMIGISPLLNSHVTDKLFALAEQNKIQYQTEVMGGSTGTDADSISKMGVPTALISIPIRYMHTPIETVDVNDIVATGELMKSYLEDEV